MIRWTVIFLIIAIVAALFGFTGIAAGAASIAKVIFFIFLVLVVVTLIVGNRTLKRLQQDKPLNDSDYFQNLLNKYYLLNVTFEYALLFILQRRKDHPEDGIQWDTSFGLEKLSTSKEKGVSLKGTLFLFLNNVHFFAPFLSARYSILT